MTIGLEVGTPELHQQFKVIEEGEGKGRHARVLSDPLSFYHDQEIIDTLQWHTGMLLYADWESKHGHRTVLEAMLSGGSFGSYRYMEYVPTLAFSRYSRAMAQLTPRQQNMAFRVIIEGRTLAELRRKGWRFADRWGADELRTLLDRLDKIYGSL